MTLFIAITLGIVYFTGFYLLLERSLMRNLVGLLILSNGINLLIFTSGSKTRGIPAFIKEETLSGKYADPLPQALILTAIVIGFGIFSFLLMLTLKSYQKLKTDDMNQIKEEF